MLTDRELQVLRLIKQLGSQMAVAKRLQRSPSTISRTVERAKAKLAQCVDLVEIVKEEGLLALPVSKKRKR